MNQPINIDEWRRSVACLALTCTTLSQKANQLSDVQQEKGGYFFTDYGVPLPRPCTALAWASLCFFGPITGFKNNQTGQIIYPRLDEGYFLLPFLPAIGANDDTTQSLPRHSKLHDRDLNDKIRWGSVFIGDAQSGQIVERLHDGHHSPRQWQTPTPRGYSVVNESYSVPPLWEVGHTGWNFGVVQNHLSGMGWTLREPMILLAQNGLIEMSRAGNTRYLRIKYLMLRFLETSAARAWAEAYAIAMQRMTQDPDSVYADRQELINEIHEYVQKKEEPAEDGNGPESKRKTKKRPSVDIFAGIEASAQLSELLGLKR